MKTSNALKAMFAGMSGTALQWYDFALFGYFAPIIATVFFPKANAVASLLHAFAVFAVGYVLAPIGSVCFGYIGDRYGRKRALTLSILIMAFSTAMIAVLPGFATIGMTAPILMTLLRMIQGFVASSEFTGSAIFLVEHAKSHRKAFYGSLTSSAYSIGVVCAGLVATTLTHKGMPDWAWRIGFGIALIAGGVIFYLRSRVPESPVYVAMDKTHQPKYPFLTALKTVPFAVIGVIGLAAMVGIITFGTYVFMVSFLHLYFDFPLSYASLIVTGSLALLAVLEPLMALFADKVGHLQQLAVGILALLLCSVPIFSLLTTGSLQGVLFGMVWMSLLIAIAFAPINAYMLSLFPDDCRYSGFGVSFHIGISFIGGTTPLVLIALVKQGDLMSPAYYYIFGAALGLFALLFCERSRRLNHAS